MFLLDKDGTKIYPSRSVASQLNIGRNTMLKRLRDYKVFDNNNYPIKQDRNLFRAYKSSDCNCDVISTYFTENGIEYVREIVKDLPKKPIVIHRELLSDELIQII